ncbi:MAG: LptA/OstA family protein, partial [Acetobacteraceae bacterium]
MRRTEPKATLFLLLLAALLWPGFATAQPAFFATGQGQQFSNREPVTFLADRLTYDRQTGVVTATGHVQAWQGERVLQADRITYNRNTGITIAT